MRVYTNGSKNTDKTTVLKKIVVIGPESTGKSHLCNLLAQHYKTCWVREYAREYLLTNGKEYTYDSLLDIAKGQVNLEENEVRKLEKNEPLVTNHKPQTLKPVFIDTDLYVMKVWSEFVFGKCHRWILDTIVERKYDLYLLCNVDLPWVKDELRECPDLPTRKKLYLHYKDILLNQTTNWVDISGNYEERFQKAITAVDGLLGI